jgi:2-aminobenzoate-CoA ligase
MEKISYDNFVLRNLPDESQMPNFIFETPELKFPEYLNAAVELLDKAVTEGNGNRIAMYGQDLEWSYLELQQNVNRICNYLIDEFDLKPGNRVLLRSGNNPWLAACWLAVFKLGAVAVGTMPLLRSKELTQIIDLAQISHAICDQALAQELQITLQESAYLKHCIYFGEHTVFEQELNKKSSVYAAYPSKATDPALIGFTSGTTGTPKGTIHFHRDVMAMCEVFPRHCLKPEPSDIFIGTPPLAFTFGLGGLLCFPLWARSATVLLEKLNPEALLKAIEKFKATICFTSPTGYRAMTQTLKQEQIHTLKKCVSAGEALPSETRKLWKKHSQLDIYDGIGGTEMIHIYIASDPNNYREGSIGKVLPGYRAKIVDDDMQELPIGKMGKLAVIGPTGCKYLSDPRQINYVKDYWNLPGDVFHQDEDGYFYYHGRTDDIIVTSGYNVSGPEVEWALLEHEDVAECAVIGIPDPDRGQIIKAFVVLKEGSLESEITKKNLQDFVKQRIAPYKYPRAIEFLKSLPRTETGKLQRFKLKLAKGVS